MAAVVLPFVPSGLLRPSAGPAAVLPFRLPSRWGFFMRRLVRRRCDTCGHGWVQPFHAGRCPQCHGEDVVTLGVSTCDLPRR